ncbi:tRNA epoxyqueuosine(34) reductase QueG [Tissierella pigra]|uniref:tRNA epoxyqueuosine(34) reductase QueG n=1 Tax=Tissierella pigra TaxID=2607614 RepID=A0A6N7XHN2_9FIRM|nr:tRNA epoxyqueuosine(34) reductase QueG [Tissierella pigra]MBU5425862.1 tRNA epoxyqueuosine(34) reductase QueG [Tissierella pigra]MSU01561.1 tRNA epoxyqueuosine(34) reductase QueG [Tissierella pigra]
MGELNQYILEKSKELNIDICGFTDSLPLYNLEEYLLYREKNNVKTEFEEKDINKRIDPRLTMDNCKSIIVLGLSYNIDYDEKPDYLLRGKLSKSSWGIDYHLVLRKKIESLVEEIKKKIDFQYKYFVDTGPLIDRELGRKSGIGYYGKNCSIINKEYGSFIFLGYILTNLNLDISKEAESECGDCNLCINACPTGALEEPYKLNPKRCISYLTQTKSNIPITLREKMGMKIYGCDTCQLVCPKNKGIKKSNHEEFIPILTKGYMNLEELLTISNKEFKRKYGTMAGSWRGKSILKRNAIIALGNMKRTENIQLLVNLLKDESPEIREYSEWAIVNIFLTISQKSI